MKNDKIGNNVLVIKNKNELKSYNLNNPIELFSYGISKKIDTTEKIIQDIIKFVANKIQKWEANENIPNFWFDLNN